MNKIIPDVETLKESFYNVKNQNTLIERECTLLQEASRFDMPLEKYEKLFELYDKDRISSWTKLITQLNSGNDYSALAKCVNNSVHVLR